MVGKESASTMSDHFIQMKLSYLRQLRTKCSTEESLVKESVEIIAATGIINSIRVQSRIQSLSQLLEVLEHRDELSETNTCILKYFADRMKCPLARSLVEQYEEEEKLMGSKKCGNICTICATKWEPPVFKVEEIEEKNGVEMTNEEPKKESRSVDAAILMIAPQLGRKWKDLSRCLGLTEYDIETIEDDYRSSMTDKIHAAFKLWRELKSDGATRDELIKALFEARRRDLAEKLLGR